MYACMYAFICVCMCMYYVCIMYVVCVYKCECLHALCMPVCVSIGVYVIIYDCALPSILEYNTRIHDYFTSCTPFCTCKRASDKYVSVVILQDECTAECVRDSTVCANFCFD